MNTYVKTIKIAFVSKQYYNITELVKGLHTTTSLKIMLKLNVLILIHFNGITIYKIYMIFRTTKNNAYANVCDYGHSNNN